MVDDRAGLFSSSAIQEANQIISRIYQDTTPHKQVFVETVSSVPAGKQADTLAAERFRQNNADGMLILIVKEPHKLAISVGRNTEQRFHGAEAARGAMLERFRQADYDGGLLAGLRFVASSFTREFAPGVGAAASAAASHSTGESERGSGSWLWLLLLGGGGLLAFLLWRLRSQSIGSATNYGPPLGDDGPIQGIRAPGPGNMAQGSGGSGWGRAIVGGAAGAMAGSWLYDHLFRGSHDGAAHAATTDPVFRGSDAPQSDLGEVGSTLGGDGDGSDWSDDGGGDVNIGGGDW